MDLRKKQLREELQSLVWDFKEALSVPYAPITQRSARRMLPLLSQVLGYLKEEGRPVPPPARKKRAYNIGPKPKPKAPPQKASDVFSSDSFSN